MARLKEEDVLEIIEMLENEIIRIPKASRIEKMRYKSKIRTQGGWLGALVNPTPKKILDKLRQRMAELFYQLPGGLSKEFKEFLDEKVKDLKTTFSMRAYGQTRGRVNKIVRVGYEEMGASLGS
jgi:hypothetical protein